MTLTPLAERDVPDFSPAQCFIDGRAVAGEGETFDATFPVTGERLIELKSATHGVITHHACPALDRFEHFDEARLRHCCDICLAAMPISGKMLNRKSGFFGLVGRGKR